ncbi:hypothetical protein [Dongia sp. agr-C8]
MAEATSRGCELAAVQYLQQLCHLVHQDLDGKLADLVNIMRRAA